MLLISGGYIYRVLLLCSPYLLTTTTDTKILKNPNKKDTKVGVKRSQTHFRQALN